MAVWLVTGATGFVGRHVLESLTGGAAALSPSDDDGVRARSPLSGGVAGATRFVAADLTDADKLRRGDRADQARLRDPHGRTNPPAPDEELYRANFWATIHLLAALRSTRKPARIVLSGSAAELGPVDPERLAGGRDLRRLPARCLRPKQMAGDFGRSCRASAAGGHRRAGLQPDRSGNTAEPGFRPIRRPADRSRSPIRSTSWSATSKPAATLSTCATWRVP